MEHIQKKYSLETAKNRSSITGVTYVDDRIVTSSDIGDGFSVFVEFIPFLWIGKDLETNEDKYLMRFKNIMRHYYWFNNEFIPSCLYRKLCLRNNKKTWIEYKIEDKNPFTSGSTITNTTIGQDFNTDNFNIGDIVCITDLYSELVNRYNTNTGTTDAFQNAKDIYYFVTDLIENKEFFTTGIGRTPYLDFTIYLEQDIVDEGILSPCVEYWVPGKKYYVGDVVYYSIDGSEQNLKTYKLFTGSTKERIEITKDIYEANSGITGETTEYSSDSGTGRYYADLQCFSGYYDNVTRLTYFDTLNNGTIRLDHWEQNIEYFSGSTTNVTGVTESRLNDVKRRKTDIDDSGNTLPFIIHYTSDTSARTIDNTYTEFPFMSGCMNYNYGDGKVTCDILEEVHFYASGGIEIYCATIENEKDLPILINTGFSSCENVSFVYYLGVTLEHVNNEWAPNYNTGVKYLEYRPVEYLTGTYTIDGSSRTLPYIVVKDTENKAAYENMDILDSMRDVNYSGIEVTSGSTNSDYYLSSPTYKDESMMGIQNTYGKIDVNIERGIAESYQKHYMFGEICTLQDLENYRNGKYFDKK